jgi:hypothetical protein
MLFAVVGSGSDPVPRLARPHDLVPPRPRETREGWPLLTVETKVNGDSKSTNEKGPSLVGRLASRAGIRDICSALAALIAQVQNSFSSQYEYTIPFPLLPSLCKLGRGSRAGLPFSLYVSLFLPSLSLSLLSMWQVEFAYIETCRRRRSQFQQEQKMCIL